MTDQDFHALSLDLIKHLQDAALAIENNSVEQGLTILKSLFDSQISLPGMKGLFVDGLIKRGLKIEALMILADEYHSEGADLVMKRQLWDLTMDLTDQAEALLNSGQAQGARSITENLIQARFNYPGLNELHGKALAATGNAETAETFLEIERRLHPRSSS